MSRRPTTSAAPAARQPDDLLNVPELAQHFRMSPGAVRIAMHRGTLGVPALRIGSRVRFRWSDVQAAPRPERA
jgi:hypothetical protein